MWNPIAADQTQLWQAVFDLRLMRKARISWFSRKKGE
jgi:hypothetical protein